MQEANINNSLSQTISLQKKYTLSPESDSTVPAKVGTRLMIGMVSGERERGKGVSYTLSEREREREMSERYDQLLEMERGDLLIVPLSKEPIISITMKPHTYVL